MYKKIIILLLMLKISCLCTSACPIQFSTATMLYCGGSCGLIWSAKQNGCKKADADDYCRLKHCNIGAYSISFTKGPSTNGPGFACCCDSNHRPHNFGSWFGIPNVYFHHNIGQSHGYGEAISNVICHVPGIDLP